ncbi:MAG: dihydrofolate reductase family protein [Labilithrix sp.]|nr:dihydrofolate reductase family protein [Labilithrix sp.]
MNDETPGRRLYVSMLASLDGFIEGPDRQLDWFLDGDPTFERYCDEMIDSVGVALYGRRSYELMHAYWPGAEKNARTPADLAFARKMNALPKVVLSRTLTRAEWSNTRVVGEDAVAAIGALKAERGKPIVAWAGAGLVATLRKNHLVDEYRVLVHPVLLGSGTRLFEDLGERETLRLVRTSQLGHGLVVLCYEPTR